MISRCQTPSFHAYPPGRKGTVIWKLQTKSLWPEERIETLAGPSGADPQELRLRPEHA